MRLFVLKGEYDVYDLTTGMKMYSFQKPDHLAPSIVLYWYFLLNIKEQLFCTENVFVY